MCFSELIQTEMHHVRTLRVMAEVYCKGLQKEVQLEVQILERMFPVLDDLLDMHTHFLSCLLELKRDAQLQAGDSGGFAIERIGDVLVNQVRVCVVVVSIGVYVCLCLFRLVSVCVCV